MNPRLTAFILLLLCSTWGIGQTLEQPMPPHIEWKVESHLLRVQADDIKTYQITITAIPQGGWSLNSQTQPKGAHAEPTIFRFEKKRGYYVGAEIMQEKGELLTMTHDLGKTLECNYYTDTVVFTRNIMVVGIPDPMLNLIIYYQCTDKEFKYYPTETKTFSIHLQRRLLYAAGVEKNLQRLH